MRALPIALALLVSACPAPAPTIPKPPPPPPPVVTPLPVVSDKGLEPPQPTVRLPKNFVPASYKARLAIDPKKPTFDGAITITGKLDAKSSVIWLHARGLDIKHAMAGTVALVATPKGEDLLELRAEPPLPAGPVELSLEYGGKLDEVNTTGGFVESSGGQRYVFTQFEAIYARRVFPCVDEPDSKVPWQLTLDVPKDMVAVSNMPETATTALDGKTKRVEFAQTKPLPSYLVAFGVGPFDVIDAGKTKSGVPVRMITLKGRGAETAWLGKNTAQLIDYLEDWFGMPYPYPKLDFLTIPMTVGFGAMENVGLITYTERGMLVATNKPSWERRHGPIMTASHELAHQWFGDYVTTAWWDDIWLNEGFANWMETKIAARFEPAWHDQLAEVNMKFGALYADSVTSARRIRQPIQTQDDILNVFDGITYDKGASVLNMFEAYVGPDVFQKGVRNYIAARAHGNATSTDFVAAISAAAGKDLAPAFSTFLDQGGAPELDAHLACDRGGPRVTMTQKRFVPPGSAPPPPGKPWIFPVCIAYEKGGKRAEQCTLVEQPEAELRLDTKTCPRWIYPNAGGHGYFHMKLGTREVATLRDEAWPLLDWRERRTLFFDVAEAARTHAGMPLQIALSLVPKMLLGGDRFTLPDALGLPIGLDMFVADDQRGKYENWLRTQFGPGAAQVGALPKDTDDLDAEITRNALYNAVAWAGRDPDLGKQAVELAASWRELPQAVRRQILTVAVDTSPDVFARVLSEVKTEKVQRLKDEMMFALENVRDPKRREQALQLVIDPAMDIRETMWILFFTPNEANRVVAEKFFRDHEKELIARMPQDEVTGGLGRMAFVFTGSCDAKRRDDIADFVTKHFAVLPGGEHDVKEAIEGMDQCIAMRASLEPEIRAWLGGWKPPPKKDKPKPAPSPAGSGPHSRRSTH